MTNWLFIPIVLLLMGLVSCTKNAGPLPEETKYGKDASLLVESSNKLAEEPSPQKLQEIAIALQKTRTLACIDYNNECSLFGSFLTFAINATKKGDLSPQDRKSLRAKAADIRLAVEEGKAKLSREWAERRSSK